MRSAVCLIALLCLTSFPASGDVPGALAGRVILDGQPASRARIEMTPVAWWSGRARRPQCVTTTNDTGRFVCLGLQPAQSYEVRITFAGGFISSGSVDNVRGAEVRHLVATTATAMCGMTVWQEDPARAPPPFFEWPLRDLRNHIGICQ